MFGQELELVQQVKYLGVVLDSKPSWTPHVDRIIQKSVSILWQLRRITGNNWGTNPEIMPWLYTAVVRPKIQYGSAVWWPGAQSSTIGRKLSKVQRLACLVITDAMRTTPTAALEVLLRLLRMRDSGVWVNEGAMIGHAEIAKWAEQEIPISALRVKSAQDRLRWNREFTLTIPSREQWEGNTVEFRAGSLVCYTNGSRLTDRQASGAGIYLEGRDVQESYALGGYTTIFQAEVFAILIVALRQEVKEGPEQRVYICSDSQAALRAICHPKPSSALVQECGDALEKLAETKEVQLVWVPGHRGGIQEPVCAVSGAKYVTEDGWVDLRNPADSDVPFRIVRDEGRAFLQWSGEPELRNRMSGRLVMVNMMCREISTIESTETPRVQMIFSPCVAFRVVGTPMKYLTNVSEVAFVQDSQTESSSITSESMSITEYVAIGICSVLLGLIYVASVFLYLHLRKRNKGNPGEKSGDDKSLRGIEEGIVKNNPLLSMPAHFIQGDQTYSDTNSSDNDAAPDIIKHYEDRKKQITSALVHPQNQKFSFNSHRPSFSSFEHSHQDSATNERLPEENVSIVETLEGREERPDNIRALSGSTRKKLYFNPAYFEPHLLMAPPPAALEFLTKIREVISIAKQKLSSKRFSPSLINIPEEENHYVIDPIYGFANPASRRSSIISLKRENSRRQTCTRCPGCDSPDLKSLSGKLPEFPSLAACHSCTMTTNESKQRSIRKWLEDVPVLKDSSEGDRSAVKPARCPKRVRSPTKALPAEEYDGNTRALPPKPAPEDNLRIERICNGNPPAKDLRKLRKPPPPPAANKLAEEENIYDTIAMEIKRGSSMQFPPPDMIQQAMEVERSEEKVATLTKEQMNAVINEFTIHKNLIIPYAESELLEKHSSPVDYETDSLERTGNKGYSTPSDYADISSSQPSPSLSTVLPDQEEMTMRNAIYNKRTGNLTISKINMDILQEDDHDYELIVMKKGAIIEHGSYKLPELLQGNNRYSLVSEVYVNSGYNYGSAPSTPGGSRYSTMDKKTLKVRYENGIEKPGKLLIEVEDCLDHYIPVHDSDEYEADTLDRKPSKNKIPDTSLIRENNQESHPERATQILLRTTGSFRSDAKTLAPLAPNQPRPEPPEESNFNRVFGSLREIYEAKTKRSVFKEVDEKDCCTVIGDEEKGRTLTLEERHSRRQRAKGAIVQPDVIPPPPHGSSPVYEHTHPAKEALQTGDPDTKSSKNSNGRSVGSKSTKSNAPTCNPTSTPSGTPDQPSEDYKLCLLQKSKKNGTITNLIQTEDVILKKDFNNNQFVLHSMLHPHAKKKKQPRPWSGTMKPEDSGYLSTDSNESRSAIAKVTAVDHGSESDESLGDGHSESGGESVETHSVFYGRFPRNMAPFRGYGSTDSGVIGGEEGPSSSDSENVSYTTVIPVTKT